MSNQKNQFAEAALIEAARHFGLEIDSKESASILIELVDLCKEKGLDVGLRDLAALRAVNSIQRPTTDSQEREFEEEMKERWKPEIGEKFWVAYKSKIGSRRFIWYNYSYQKNWYNQDRIRKTESEALERSKELNTQREVTEAESADSGNDEPIKPTGPLREMPNGGDQIYYVTTENGVYKEGFRQIFEKNRLMFEAGRVFPGSESGRLGAERRAKQGILPPIDREELHRMYRRIIVSDDQTETPVVDLLIYLQSTLEGGNQNE